MYVCKCEAGGTGSRALAPGLICCIYFSILSLLLTLSLSFWFSMGLLAPISLTPTSSLFCCTVPQSAYFQPTTNLLLH